MQMSVAFNMHQDAGGSGVYERLDRLVRTLNHQMHVDRQRRRSANRIDHFRIEPKTRNEVSVHDIDMKPIHARRFHLADLLCQTRQISG